MLQRAQSKPVLQELLDHWHGDEDTMGWASPTLALNIALLTRPENARNLAEKIYGEDTAYQYDKSLIRIINAGYKLYRDS